MNMQTTFLSSSEIRQFMGDGFIHLREAIPADLAETCAQAMLRLMEIDEHDPATWHRVLQPGYGNRAANLPHDSPRATRYCYETCAPRLHAAMCDLMGGPERLLDRGFRDNGVFTLADPEVLKRPDADSRWRPPSRDGRGWHVDGGAWFTHYLDSPEVGLLVIILFRDATQKGGATYFAPQSPKLVSRFYAEHPTGENFDRAAIMAGCDDLRCAEGKAGDAFILHPFMMHTASLSVSPRPRLMENDNVSFQGGPMRFDWDDPAEASVVERSILGHLGTDYLQFERRC